MYPVEDEVADNHQVNCCLAAQDGEHVAGHTLPKVNKEILYLELEWKEWDISKVSQSVSQSVCKWACSCDKFVENYASVKVGIF